MSVENRVHPRLIPPVTATPVVGSIEIVGSPDGCRNGESILDTLIVRKIDDLGRIVVPAESRRLFNIHEGDELAITVENNGIVLRKLEATCVFCEGTEDLRNYRGRGVCAECRSNLSGAIDHP